MDGHSLQKCKNIKSAPNMSNTVEKPQSKPKAKVYVSKQSFVAVSETKGK